MLTVSQANSVVYPYIHIEPLFDIRVWNARSIRNKTTTLNAYVIQHDIDETWLATDDPVFIGELKPDGYDYLNFPRGTSNHEVPVCFLNHSLASDCIV